MNTCLKTYFGYLTLDCELQYFNSPTAKLLLNILLQMDSHAIDVKRVTVNGVTTADNDIIIECGKDFMEELGALQFNMVTDRRY